MPVSGYKQCISVCIAPIHKDIYRHHLFYLPLSQSQYMQIKRVCTQIQAIHICLYQWFNTYRYIQIPPVICMYFRRDTGKCNIGIWMYLRAFWLEKMNNFASWGNAPPLPPALGGPQRRGGAAAAASGRHSLLRPPPLRKSTAAACSPASAHSAPSRIGAHCA